MVIFAFLVLFCFLAFMPTLRIEHYKTELCDELRYRYLSQTAERFEEKYEINW
jgi:hypothetical protein